MFGRLIANLVHEQIPEYTSVERQIKNRQGKMYIDFLQNRPGATLAGPYSLRPKSGATVSMPLHWEEVKPGLTMRDFTIFNTVDRLKIRVIYLKVYWATASTLKKPLKKHKLFFIDKNIDIFKEEGRVTPDQNLLSIS